MGSHGVTDLIPTAKRWEWDDAGILVNESSVGASGAVVAEKAARGAAGGWSQGNQQDPYVLKSGGRWVDE